MSEARLEGAIREVPRLFRALNQEQRVAAVAAVLLLVSTFGPFSFVEAAEVLIALAVLALLRARALGRRFHLPFGDGTAIALAGLWAGLLIVVRLFDRSLGQNLLALACATMLAAAGVRERAKRPADDLPAKPVRQPSARSGGEGWLDDVGPKPAVRPTRPARRASSAEEDPTETDVPTEPLPPPEFEPTREVRRSGPANGEAPETEPGEQLMLGESERPKEDDELSPPAESPGESESESPGRSGA
jgi:hypothetical protein